MRCLRLLTLPLLALLLVAAGYPDPPEAERYAPGRRAGLVNDGSGGCWLWVGGIDPAAEAMRATWTGPCEDSRADGDGRSVITWRDGGQERSMVHVGILRRGRAEGRGRLTHYEGRNVIAIEDGEFRDDRFVNGRFELPGRVVYQGGWGLRGPEGQGTAVVQGRRVEGVWSGGCLQVGKTWVSFLRPAQECEGAPT